MKNSKITMLFLVSFLVIGTLAALFFPKEEKKNADAVLRIGAGDDVSGLLMKETVSELKETYKIADEMEDYSFQDCCSNSAQWAMNAEEINIGFYCSHIAKHTVEQNQNVMIYGPAIMNGEIICYKNKWEEVSKIGVTQGREQLKKISEKTYPQIQYFDEITQKGILYTLEDGQIDAAILDISKTSGLKEYEYTPLAETDYISYVLVVDKQFAKTKAFVDFIESYNQAVSRLNNKNYLARALEIEEGSSALGQIKFLSLDEKKE